ncbi:MAG: imidazole glycerol phosphate synthase subunit HisH [candidate division KSB1 bacterium]|nr:imidazole glycerol phosphate synthase subunit HisH [candidate division KSB1 bacterium]
MICVIDYNAGNLRSVQKALEICGANTIVSSEPDDMRKADKVVFPGVGAFGKAMHTLKELQLVEPIREVIDQGKPFLGICLGLQLLHETSEESPGVTGLSVIKGRVKRFSDQLKVPHLGWNVLIQQPSPLWNQVPDESYFYFAHSYYIQPADEDIVTGESEYDGQFAVAVRRDNVFGLQFHPEKSQKYGLQILKNFIEL